MLSKLQLMRSLPFSILISALSTLSILAASPAGQPEATSTVPAAAAEAGKDVVHQLNNAFAQVFEIVAPSVVIIEISKKSDGAEGSAFDDLFFQGPPDENNPHGNLRRPQPVQSEGSGFIVRPVAYLFRNFHFGEGAARI